MMHRRSFMALAGASAAALTVPRYTAHAVEIGGGILRTVSDGNLSLPPGFIFDPMPQDELAAVLAEYGVTTDAPLTPPCNITLWQDGENTVLFDAGAGVNFQGGVGALVDALDALDIAPEDVTHVVFTHGHPDHLWGVLDDFDDPMFYEAVHMMGTAEHAYWTNPETAETIGEARASFAAGAARRLEVIGEDMVLFDAGDVVLPGITAVATPGHTPGHMAFHIADGAQQAMVVGDAIGNPHVAFAKPGWSSGSDQDMETAAKTRVGLLDRLASDEMTMVGFHLPDGGIGRVLSEKDGYRFEGV